ncbi:hypothetical protein EPN42_01775 [bacterium]|nr:MAG: hypothetical protein EPN42_01775 [bacterium]
MRRFIATLFSALAVFSFTAAVSAAPSPGTTVDPALIPDGTYTVTVTKVVDPQHLLVVMPGNMKTELEAARTSISFAKVKEGDSLKVSTGKGKILVFMDMTQK